MAMNPSFRDQELSIEMAYRRGVHQAMAFAEDLAGQAENLGEAKRLLRAAEAEAFRLRSDRSEGNGALLDTIRGRISRRRKPVVTEK